MVTLVKKLRFFKTLLYVFGLMFSLGMTLLMYLVFLAAYFSPGKEIVITANTFGEALPEFIIIPIAVGSSIFAVYLAFKMTLVARK